MVFWNSAKIASVKIVFKLKKGANIENYRHVRVFYG